MKTTFLYTLNCPKTGEIRYLGKSDNPFARFKRHLRRAALGTYKGCWILSLRVEGLTPTMDLLDEVPTAEWEFWEREYIRVFRAAGVRLTNQADGGDGGATTSGKKLNLSSEERNRRRVFASTVLPDLRRMDPEEVSRRRRERAQQRRIRLKGAPLRARSGFTCSEEHKKKVSEAKKLWYKLNGPMSEETRKKISEAKRASRKG